jgi:hypothetical protein
VEEHCLQNGRERDFKRVYVFDDGLDDEENGGGEA